MPCCEYTREEQRSFWFHIFIFLGCLPGYLFVPDHFGLLTAPYMLFVALRPKPQYLLPIILHCAYGGQQRSFFCLGCFLYVCFHFGQLRRFGLHWFYLFYMALAPFFFWYLQQKFFGPRVVGGVGEVTNGIGTYFLFSCAFWAALSMKRIGRLFYRGFLIFSLIQVLVASFRSVEPAAGGVQEESVRGIGSFLVFIAIPYVMAFFSYCIVTKRGREMKPELFISAFGAFLIVLNFFHILSGITFTLAGLGVLAALYVWLGCKRRSALLRVFCPLVLFSISIPVVLLSARIVERYGSDETYGIAYDEMSMTNFRSIMTKLRRKAIDERANVWYFNIENIKNKIKSGRAIWVDVDQTASALVYKFGEGYVELSSNMGAHNTMLQLLRFYGFYGGLGLYLLFIFFFVRPVNLEILKWNADRSMIVVILATCLAEGVVGGHTGHYPVNLSFGPVMFALLGTCWRIYHEGKWSTVFYGTR